MKRTIYKKLEDWKKSSIRKPLILRGARQVGKTFIVKQFARTEFKNHLMINFERNPEYNQVFDSFEPEKIIQQIELLSGQKIIPGETLIFLDEIQDCPRAIMSLRYFFEELPDLHLICAGSLLEFALAQKEYTIPVGRVQYMYMYPMSFLEFLGGIGEATLSEFIQKKSNIETITEAVHNKLTELIQLYFYIGGMPEIINQYNESKNLIDCRNLQFQLLETYRDDFLKYSSNSELKYVQKVFDATNHIIGKKVVYSKIDQTIKSRDLKNALNLLETAGILKKVMCSSADKIPLASQVKEQFYKTVFLDIGLMNALNNTQVEFALKSSANAMFTGMIAEQFVGQELIVNSDENRKSHLFYWARSAKNSNAEVDFVIEKDNQIIPIEVKSGKKGTLKSLALFLQNKPAEFGLKISQNKFMEEEGLISIPFYGINVFFQDM